MFHTSELYSLDFAIAKVLCESGNHSGGFWFARDLALDLFSEFQRPCNLPKNFGCPARASHNDSSVAQDPSHARLFHRDAFDPLQKKLDGAAIDDPRLYDDSLVGDGHLRGAALHETNSEKNCRYQQTGDTSPSQRTRERNFATLYGTPRSEQQAQANEREDCGDQSMSQHYNPVQPGFILHRFARNEMLFGVAQEGSLKKREENYCWGSCRG
jgi:hypothetical protein